MMPHAYVYAITDRPNEPLPKQLGLDDEALALVVCHDIGAVISARDGSHLSATTDELWRHEEVVEALMSLRAVLPVRFGTLLPRQHVGDMLRRAYPRFVQDIERVRGHVEIGMRFLTVAEHEPETDPPAIGNLAAGAVSLPRDGKPRPAAWNGSTKSEPAPGTAYLRARLTRERDLRHRRQVQLSIVRKVYRMLIDHASASRLDDEPNDRDVISAAFLVPQDRLVSFRQFVDRMADAHPELALLCTGPWPAYSFVNANACEPAANRSGHGHAH